MYALGANGTLHGQVVNAAGTVVAGVEITVRQNENVLARTTSSPAGENSKSWDCPAVYSRITTDQSEASLRLWAAETAPPGASSSVLLVHDQAAVRGQSALGSVAFAPVWPSPLSWRPQLPFPFIVHQIDVERKSGS